VTRLDARDSSAFWYVSRSTSPPTSYSPANATERIYFQCAFTHMSFVLLDRTLKFCTRDFDRAADWAFGGHLFSTLCNESQYCANTSLCHIPRSNVDKFNSKESQHHIDDHRPTSTSVVMFLLGKPAISNSAGPTNWTEQLAFRRR